IVSVSAKDKMTGLEQAMQITPSSGLSPDEIEKLIIEAETSIERDRDEKELIVERNKLDTLVKNARRAMTEVGRSFELEEQQSINGILNEAEDALATTSLDEIKIQLSKVEAAANRITAAMLAMA
ncbi:MAG: Hsp70 family protein, partial [Pyrinomonadaceae bacterium]|nr:Hsp70 family protein [Pyrinomonadaceae bacterium]